jgi:hypothetical protein
LSKTRICAYLDGKAWKKFMEICVRENESASGKIENFVIEYVIRHGPGNPVIPLDKFNDPVLRTCELCSRPANHLWNVLYISGKVLRSCKPCIEIRTQKKLVKKILHLA